MHQGLLLLAGLVKVASEVWESLEITRRDQVISVVTTSSVLVLTPEELRAWNSDIDVETRTAIYRRGLIRFDLMQKPQEAHGGAE